MELEWIIQVGFTSGRPIIPDEYTAWVRIVAETENDAHLLAVWMVGSWPHCEMVTRTEIVDAIA
jgi:hypothetical protein